jgi:hypothetical protein
VSQEYEQPKGQSFIEKVKPGDFHWVDSTITHTLTNEGAFEGQIDLSSLNNVKASITPMTDNDCTRTARNTRVLVADKNLMNAQLLAQALGHDPKFRVATVSISAELMAAGRQCRCCGDKRRLGWQSG